MLYFMSTANGKSWGIHSSSLQVLGWPWFHLPGFTPGTAALCAGIPLVQVLWKQSWSQEKQGGFSYFKNQWIVLHWGMKMNGKWESTWGWIFIPLESLRALLLVSMGSKVIHQLGSVVTSAENWKISLFPDWESAIRVGVLDCGEEGNYETCKEYGIHYYPTFRVSGRTSCLRQMMHFYSN